MSLGTRFVMLIALWALAVPAQGAERILTGELVALDGSATRFRLVGHEGSLTAPPGTPLDQLDGRAVRVELSADGRVTRISEQHVAITPITSGWETVRGQLEVRDAAARTFGVVGDRSTYVAPPGLDLAPYAGKWVEATIAADGRASAVILLADRPPPAPPTPAVAPLGGGTAPTTCVVGDATVASGSSVCRGGIAHRCERGTWINLGTACQ